MGRPTGRRMIRSMGILRGRPMGRPTGGPMGRPMERPMGRLMGRLLGRLLGRPVGRPMGRPMARPCLRFRFKLRNRILMYPGSWITDPARILGPWPGSLSPVQGRARPSAHVILAWV